MVAQVESEPAVKEVRDYLSAALGIDRNCIQVHLNKNTKTSPNPTNKNRGNVHQVIPFAKGQWTKVKYPHKKRYKKAELRLPSVRGTSTGNSKSYPRTTIHPGLYKGGATGLKYLFDASYRAEGHMTSKKTQSIKKKKNRTMQDQRKRRTGTLHRGDARFNAELMSIEEFNDHLDYWMNERAKEAEELIKNQREPKRTATNYRINSINRFATYTGTKRDNINANGFAKDTNENNDCRFASDERKCKTESALTFGLQVLL